MPGEPLEQRVLLAADLNYHALDDMQLQLQAEANSLQIVDANRSALVLAAENLAALTGGVTIGGDGYDVSLTIDQSVPQDVADGIHFHGGSGHDTLIGPGIDTEWGVTGYGAGTVGGSSSVRFTGVEDLIGAADNEDTFVLHGDAHIDGVFDGGDAGFDTLVVEGRTVDRVSYVATGPHSGSIDLDGTLIRYAGVEPLSLDLEMGELIIDADDHSRGIPGTDDLVLTNATASGKSMLDNADSVNATIETVTFTSPEKVR